jgi:hypothetical protein
VSYSMHFSRRDAESAGSMLLASHTTSQSVSTPQLLPTLYRSTCLPAAWCKLSPTALWCGVVCCVLLAGCCAVHAGLTLRCTCMSAWQAGSRGLQPSQTSAVQWMCWGHCSMQARCQRLRGELLEQEEEAVVQHTWLAIHQSHLTTICCFGMRQALLH